MDQLHRSADKLASEANLLSRTLRSDTSDEDVVAVALASAKRVRRESTIIVKLLASLRDQLQP